MAELSRTRVRFGHTVITPRTSLHADFSTPDCPRWSIHGKAEMGDLAGRLWDIAARQESGHRVPSHDDCDLIAEILLGRNLPQRSLLAEADERETRADRLTIEQASILGATRLINRLEIRGGAGSGKTLLAMTQAKELTRGGGGRPSQRVALLCYSIGLASWFRRLMATVDRRHRPAFCGTFEDLARYLGVDEFGGRDDPTFWEEGLPAPDGRAGRRSTRRQEVRCGRRGRGTGLRRPLVDADHAVPARRGVRWPVRLQRREPASLRAVRPAPGAVGAAGARSQPPQHPSDRRDLRTARPDADVRPRRRRSRRSRTYRARLEDALEAADEAVDALLEDWRPEDVALLTTGARHEEQVSRQELLGQDGYWDTFWDADQVFYGHVLGFKGLERRVVVLAANETSVKDRSRERLYVGLSRATDKLVVVGPPELIKEIGGPEVAKRLGITK